MSGSGRQLAIKATDPQLQQLAQGLQVGRDRRQGGDGLGVHERGGPFTGGLQLGAGSLKLGAGPAAGAVGAEDGAGDGVGDLAPVCPDPLGKGEE